MSLLTGAEQRNTQFLLDALRKYGVSAPPTLRTIDKIRPEPRTTPVKLLCLGMSRTGTFSLLNALERLGYHPYHMAEAIKNAPVDFPVWEEAVRAKYLGEGAPFTKEDFDKFLGRFDTLMEIPTLMFSEELINMYPEAKIIVTHRPVNGWLRSMRTTVLESVIWWRWSWVAWADPDMAKPFIRFARWCWPIVFGDLSDKSADNSPDPLTTHPDSSAAKYLRHYQHLREICPADRLLKMELGDGYEKLCPFLGIEPPDEPYPNINSKDFFLGFHHMMLDRATWYATERVLAYSVPVIAAGAAMLFYSQRLHLNSLRI